MAYPANLLDRKLSTPATVARRLSALKSAVKLARQLGRVSWTLDIEAPEVQGYRTRPGPAAPAGAAMSIGPRTPRRRPAAGRDLALVRLLHDTALRRAEAIGLDLGHVDLERGVTQVLGKGKTGRVPITLPPPTRGGLADWIAAAGGRTPGPLFNRLDRGARGPGRPAA